LITRAVVQGQFRKKGGNGSHAYAFRGGHLASLPPSGLVVQRLFADPRPLPLGWPYPTR
jgi:hypothetical protein